MKKNISRILVVAMLLGVAFTFAACGGGGGGGGTTPEEPAETLICGVTPYPPMSFEDDNGDWTGFDTEFALLVGDILGMDVSFQLIDWSLKFIELDSGAIDAIWNGFTATALEDGVTPRIELADMSYSYMTNTQSVIVRSDRASEFNSAEDLTGKSLAAEAGSAGEGKATALVGDNGNVVGTPYQNSTFMEVMSGAVDGAVIDLILAEQMAGMGDFADLVIADIDLGHEVFAIGFRKGDPLRDRVNQAMMQLYNDGTLEALAEKYGLSERFHVDTAFGR